MKTIQLLSRLFNVSVIVGISSSFFGCIPKTKQASGNEGSSPLKSITINQPDLAKEMRASISEEEKKKILDSLVYQIAINVKKQEAKDDCIDGVTPTKFETGVLELAKSSFESIKVKKGCNYIISMQIGAKTDDGKQFKTVYLASWDDKNPSVLTKEELEKATPAVKVDLYVTNEGKKYWDTEVIVTPTEADTTINAGLAKTFKLKAEAPKVTVDATTAKISGSVDFVPVSEASKDMYCSLAIHTTFAKSATDSETRVHPVFLSGDISKSYIKIPAASTAKISLATFEEVPASLPSPYMVVKASSLYAYCFTDEAAAVEKLKSCFGESSGANWPACELSSISAN